MSRTAHRAPYSFTTAVLATDVLVQFNDRFNGISLTTINQRRSAYLERFRVQELPRLKEQ
jgi:hypothetical protein